jgi:pimeloyl-ACP methyl ester carboxylesterase
MLAMPDVEIYQDVQSRFIDLLGMRVHFKREGKGVPVVLLHGSGSSLHAFDGVAARLAGLCEVIRMDLPGFGLTGPRLDRDYRVDTYVTFLKEFLDRLGVAKAVIAGNSLGGNIAWNLALAHPDCVLRLVLMNATGYPAKTLPLAMKLAQSFFGRLLLKLTISRKSTAANLRKLVGPRMTTIPDALVDRVSAMIKRPGNFKAFVDLANTRQRDNSAQIQNINVPTLVLRGESIDGQHFARDIAGSREIVLAGVGHLMPEEAPEEVASAVGAEAKQA